jgi:hypothetical protein
VLFGEVIDISGIRTDGILALNDEMRNYVASKVKANQPARSRLKKLIRGMIEDGLLTLDYDPNLTYTAIETFQNRQGNCLSFSILFASLAREANLDVTFQMVDIPPSFRADGEIILELEVMLTSCEITWWISILLNTMAITTQEK